MGLVMKCEGCYAPYPVDDLQMVTLIYHSGNIDLAGMDWNGETRSIHIVSGASAQSKIR